MTSLYITEHLSVLRRSGGSLIVTLDEDPDGKGPLPERRRILAEIEPHLLEAVMLVGEVHITSDATQFCLREGIAVSWLTLGGKMLGRIAPEMPRSADLRLLQYEEYRDTLRRILRARNIVASKLVNAAEVLEAHRSNHPSEELAAAIAEIQERVASAEKTENVETLLGIEGTGARIYFAAFSSAFLAEIVFGKRLRRPAPDPANALLSFGYTLLAGMTAGYLEGRGLDPAIGFFHEIRPGRPSLALDLIEELRHPVVDRFVLRTCNLRIFNTSHFEPDTKNLGGVRLTRPGLKTFFRAWEEHLAQPMREKGGDEKITPRDLIARQIDRLAMSVRGKESYRPFRFEG